MKGSEVQSFLQAYNRGDYPHQRLGQAFVNKFGHDHCDHGSEYPDEDSNSACLFYQQNSARAVKAIWERVTD